jgi:hypothetical protein
MSDIEMEAVRPKFIKDHHLTFLDDLRSSGATNMYGAAPYIQAAYRMPRDKAVATLMYWMQTFSQRHPEKAAK